MSVPIQVKLDSEIIDQMTRLVRVHVARHRAELATIVSEIEAYGYECQAGPLTGNVAWARLRELAGHDKETAMILKIEDDGAAWCLIGGGA